MAIQIHEASCDVCEEDIIVFYRQGNDIVAVCDKCTDTAIIIQQGKVG